MKKKIAVITFLHKGALLHKAQIESQFGDAVEVSVFAFDNNPVDQKIDADLAVISIYPVYVAVEPYLDAHTQVVIVSTTITCAQFERIMAVPAGERALIVNYSREMTMESLALFKQLGINHIDMLPYYPGMKTVPEVSVAITPGELHHVPKEIPQVIDIGSRVLSGTTLVEIAIKLGMGHLIQTEGFARHLEGLKSYSVGMQEVMGRAYALEGELQSLLDIMDDGIVAVNLQGIVHALNKRAEEIFSVSRAEALEKPAGDRFKEIPFVSVLSEGLPQKNRLIRIRDQNVRMTVVPVMVAGYVGGALAMLREFSREEKVQHELRAQLLNRGYRARYTFEDIVGETVEMKELKEIAARMARSDGSVLISGESGTGKELFAQAIHNASVRRDYQFVAVNCAALPETLLESELFGYEEGAFTGARKGGKPGLFELAHQGTLFLDEIGEMALHLQSRLLRVLQEREVTRLGGDRVIKVDIRIVTATNADLIKAVHEGRFRKDLYYRLSVLPLRTVPLRDRTADIPMLVRFMQKDLESSFHLSEDAWHLLTGYPWEGNVRELRNAVEFMAYLAKPMIQAKDLKNLGIGAGASRSEIGADPRYETLRQTFRGEEKALSAILQVLMGAYHENRRVGRRSLATGAPGRAVNLTEGQCRRILSLMEEQDLIRQMNGRGGTRLTELGYNWACYLQNRENRD